MKNRSVVACVKSLCAICCIAVLLISSGCGNKTTAQSANCNYSQTNQIVYDSGKYIVADRDRLLYFSEDGEELEAVQPDFGQQTQIAELLLRDQDGYVYRLAPDRRTAERLPGLRPVHSLLAAGGQLYYAGKSVCDDLWCWNDGKPVPILDDLMPGRQVAVSSEKYLYYLDAQGTPFRFDLERCVREQTAEIPCEALAAGSEECYLLCGEDVIRISDGQCILHDVKRLWTCDKDRLYYASADAGVVVWDGKESTVLITEQCANVQVCGGMMIYLTPNPQKSWEHLMIP